MIMTEKHAAAQLQSAKSTENEFFDSATRAEISELKIALAEKTAQLELAKTRIKNLEATIAKNTSYLDVPNSAQNSIGEFIALNPAAQQSDTSSLAQDETFQRSQEQEVTEPTSNDNLKGQSTSLLCLSFLACSKTAVLFEPKQPGCDAGVEQQCDLLEAQPGHGGGCRRSARVKNPLYTCEYCGKIWRNITHLRRHIRVHTGDKPFSCDICGRCFSQKISLSQHNIVHTYLPKSKSFECATCGKHCSTKGNLSKHMLIHSGEKPFECAICGMRFTQKSSLSDHNRIHTGEKPFRCELCGKHFRTASYLTVHTRWHAWEKPFQCGQCGSRFVTSGHLHRHQRTHTAALRQTEAALLFNP